MNTQAKTIVGSLVGIFIIAGLFLTSSGIVSIDMDALSASALGSFIVSRPTVTFTKNVNSPNGVIAPGRSQVLGVFDVRPLGLTQAGTLNSINFSLPVSGNTDITVDRFSLNYQYCLPKSLVYGYGYSGVLCRSLNSVPTGVIRDGAVYRFQFSTGFPIIPQQTSAILTVIGYPRYNNNPLKKQVASIRLSVDQGVVTSNSCKMIYYGFKNMYGYSKCSPISIATESRATGNPLILSRAYGYGYSSGTLTKPATTPAPVITSVVPDRASVGTMISVKGMNFSGFEGDKSVWIQNAAGQQGFINGDSTSTSTLVHFKLANKYCTVDTSYSGKTCTSFLNIVPGVYSLYTMPFGIKSNVVTFVVTK